MGKEGAPLAVALSPAKLFAFQILLGVAFGIRRVALALPLMAVVGVMTGYFNPKEAAAKRQADGSMTAPKRCG